MPDRLAEIDANLDRRTFAKTCEDKGCSVSLSGIGPAFRLINTEAMESPIPRSRRRCDFIAFAERNAFLHVAVIELKSGGFDPDDVAEQLQEGAEAVERICTWRKRDRFHAVLVHERNLRKQDRKRKMVRFRGNDYRVRRETCGTSMLKILSLESSLPPRRRMPK